MTAAPKKRRAHPATAQRNNDAKRAALLRRRAIAELMVQGITGAQAIAAKLQIPLRTIQRDLQAVEADFRASITNVIEVRRGQQLAQIDAAKNSLWAKIQKGGVLAITPYVALLNREAKLLGLDAPIAIDLQWRTALEGAGVDPAAAYTAVVAALMEHLRGGSTPLLSVPELDVLDFSPLDDFGRRDDDLDELEGEAEDG